VLEFTEATEAFVEDQTGVTFGTGLPNASVPVAESWSV
jgi:hypothetical protein